eukprot:g18843.t1
MKVLGEFSITVLTLGQKSSLVTVQENELVETLKWRLEQQYGIPVKQQKVMYQGKNGSCDDLKSNRRLKEIELSTAPCGVAPDFRNKRRWVQPLPPMPKFPPPQEPSREVREAVPNSPRPPNRPVPRGSDSGRRITPTVAKNKAIPTKPPSTCSTSATSATTVSCASINHSKSWSPPISGGATPKAPESFCDMHSRSKASTPGAPAVNVAIAQPGQAGVARIRKNDLQRVGRLGVGAFGLVTLEADLRNGRTYALKAVSKGYLAHLRMEYSVLNEKRILKMLDTPFVVRLLATYNGRQHVYFLLEAALGGELFTTYERLKLYGSEVHARFYVACVTEALAHLHEKNVIYRDLKPENLLLDVHGFCKAGWTRHAPFESKTGNAQETYSLVKRGIEQVPFPKTFKREATDLVRTLCHRNPEVRVRTPQLREHHFFQSFDWPGLQGLRVTPPLVPQVRGPRDLSNFRDCEHEERETSGRLLGAEGAGSPGHAVPGYRQWLGHRLRG